MYIFESTTKSFTTDTKDLYCIKISTLYFMFFKLQPMNKKKKHNSTTLYLYNQKALLSNKNK